MSEYECGSHIRLLDISVISVAAAFWLIFFFFYHLNKCRHREYMMLLWLQHRHHLTSQSDSPREESTWGNSHACLLEHVLIGLNSAHLTWSELFGPGHSTWKRRKNHSTHSDKSSWMKRMACRWSLIWKLNIYSTPNRNGNHHSHSKQMVRKLSQAGQGEDQPNDWHVILIVLLKLADEMNITTVFSC